jgi:hypothetical protein
VFGCAVERFSATPWDVIPKQVLQSCLLKRLV